MTNSRRWYPTGYFVHLHRPASSMLLLFALSMGYVGCRNSCPTVVRPKVGQLPNAKRQLLDLNLRENLKSLSPDAGLLPQAKLQLLYVKLHENLNSLAPNSVDDNDPPVCLKQGVPDPKESPLGGHSSIAPYTFSTQPHIQDMYATLYIDTEICTDQSLSPTDESRLQKVLSVFKISKAQSFVANLSLTGDAQGGIKYPQLVPFSYSLDNSTNKYNVSTSSVSAIPWQATTAFEIGWSYNSSKSVTIGTADLFTKIVTAVAGAGGTSGLLSPAANAYLSAGNIVLQDVASALSNTSLEADSHHFDLKQGPDSPARSVTFRFRDLSNRPLAGVRLSVGFTNSLLTQDIIDTTADDSKHVPHFDAGDEVPAIVNVTVAGPSGEGAQTLLQQISKDQAYQNLLKSTADTTAASFLSDCKNFENDLQTTYGLNKYDTALTMGYVLSQNTLYLSYDKFYSSGCFLNGRNLLKTMGINVFDKKPSS